MHTFELQHPSRQEAKQQDGSELQLLNEHSDLYGHQTPAPIPQQVRSWLLALSGLLLLPIALSIAALALSAAQFKQASSSSGNNSSSAPGDSSAVRVAFGSCTAYDLRPQPIWTEGVIPSSPHAWLWVGDMAYMDDPLVDCHSTDAGFPECSCAADWLRAPPLQCFAGDPVHAQKRMQQQLLVPEYRAFLGYMCPGYEERGVFPPIGTDPAQCRYLLSGVYDDHDSGWNNGDGRNPAKMAIKNIFLDGIGEHPSSPRRSSMNGLQTRYTLRGASLLGPSGGGVAPGQGQGQGQQSEAAARDVEMVLMDQRWYRETMPCSRRRAACDAALNSSEATGWRAWCEDFLISGGPGKTGSCCRKDDEWDAWCGAASTSHPLWAVLCDPTSALFATQQLLLGPDNTTVLPNTPGLWDTPGDQWLRLLEASTSPMCEVLGAPQRAWLSDILADSPAPVKLIASGSVLVPSHPSRGPAACSGDDWACWRRAQLNVLHTIANTTTGCPVVLVGDYHYSDLKVVLPGPQQPYAAELRSARLKKPVYQVMSSGLTTSTARSAGEPCRGSLQEDTLGARLLGPCSYVPQPAFGMVEVDWAAGVMTLSIRNGSTGGVAYGVDGKLQQLRVSLRDCQLL